MTDWGDVTPGPWGQPEWCEGTDENGNVVVGPNWLIDPPILWVEKEADARVLSKAYLIPRLAGALESCADVISHITGEDDEDAQMFGEMAADLRALLEELRSEP